MNLKAIAVRVTLLLGTATSTYAPAGETMTCRVVGIADGDTLTCLTADKKQERIRLRGIDAPERKQPYGARSTQSLSDLTFGKTATVHWNSRDRWGRIIGAIWVEPADCIGCGPTLDAGRAQIASGMAWWFKRYAKQQPLEERLSYEFEEKEARARRIGLWLDPQPIPPWDWRKSGMQTSAKRPVIGEIAAHRCGAKRYCEEMTSCEEARLNMEQCGARSLDGDGDGRPCETVCSSGG